MSYSDEILVGARSSPLSRAQVEEVYKELKSYFPAIKFRSILVKTTGDLDKKTSLRNLGQTDFFTKEVDEMVINGVVRIGVHSAKDLPNPLASDLEIAAITKGVDASDVLVLREGQTLDSIPPNALIATSSQRREENACQLKPDFSFVDIRGTIEERLEKLYQKEIDGVVIAEAALIRLRLTHLNRIKLPGPVASLQGRLAILVKKGDTEMLALFSCLHYESNCTTA